MTPRITPSYNKLVLDMMMRFPTLCPNELTCQRDFFMSTSEVAVQDRQIIDERAESTKNYPIDFTAEAILGDRKSNDKSKEENWKKFESGESCYFHGPEHNHPELMLFNCWSRQEGKASDRMCDIFNAVLDDAVDLPKDWAYALELFCHQVMEADAQAAKAYLVAYCLTTTPSGWEDHFNRYWKDFQDAQKAARLVWHKLNPNLKKNAEASRKAELSRIEQQRREKARAQRALRVSLALAPKVKRLDIH